jgi:hypothetical protein
VPPLSVLDTLLTARSPQASIAIDCGRIHSIQKNFKSLLIFEATLFVKAQANNLWQTNTIDKLKKHRFS